MAVTLRLLRLGKINHPVYRIVAIDKRKKRNGTYNDIIGSYNPTNNKSPLTINQEKLASWLSKGATISEGFHKLLKYNKKLPKTK